MSAYNHKDPLMFKAHREGFRARSVFKLEELDKKFHFFATGMKVLDLGAAPGSWLQFASDKIGPAGKILGLDLQPIAPVGDNVTTEICDISDLDKVTQVLTSHDIQTFDLVISDLAPNTTGINYVDQLNSVRLNKAVFEVAKKHLIPSGRLIMKVFPGEHFDRFLKELKLYYKDVSVQRVSASRESSREVYVVCEKAQR